MTNDKSCWDLANLIIGKTNRILLYGAPGTGKTYSAVKQNAPLNINGEANVFQLTMTEEANDHFLQC